GVTTGNGDGWQSSHWKHQPQNGGVYIGIMDPAISPGIRRQITQNDLNALNVFGYNRDNSNPPPPAPPRPTPPPNDNFANAVTIIGCTGSVTGTNVGATKEPNEPNHGPPSSQEPDGNEGPSSVWYQWQAPGSGSVTMTTAGSNYDTMLGVYTGTSVSSLTALAK